jgi:hypothetical protein
MNTINNQPTIQPVQQQPVQHLYQQQPVQYPYQQQPVQQQPVQYQPVQYQQQPVQYQPVQYQQQPVQHLYQQQPVRQQTVHQKKIFSISLCLLITFIIFLIVVVVWTIWAYFIFRYSYARVNSKIIKKYTTANPNAYNKEIEDIKSDNLKYNYDKTILNADIIIYDKKTLATIRKSSIILKIISDCSPISVNCIKL